MANQVGKGLVATGICRRCQKEVLGTTSVWKRRQLCWRCNAVPSPIRPPCKRCGVVPQVIVPIFLARRVCSKCWRNSNSYKDSIRSAAFVAANPSGSSPPPPEVDPTRQQRLACYAALAAAEMELFAPQKWGRIDHAS